MENYSLDYLLYLLIEEIEISDYNLYNHKAGKATLNNIIRKYFNDYIVKNNAVRNGNRELTITIFDRKFIDDPEDISFNVRLLCY